LVIPVVFLQSQDSLSALATAREALKVAKEAGLVSQAPGRIAGRLF
jgi:hypothetical protein